MEPRLVTPEDLRRAGVEQEQLQQLGRMAEMLQEVKTHTVDASSLEHLNIVLGRPLDVDGKTAPDFSTTFFVPWISEELIQELGMDPACRGYWGDTWQSWSTIKPAEFMIPTLKSSWFDVCLQHLCATDSTIWDHQQ